MWENRTQHRTTTTIDREDFKFLKEKNIKVAHAVRAFCAERRSQDSGAYKETITNLRESRDKQIALRDNFLKVLQATLSEAQFDEFIQKI